MHQNFANIKNNWLFGVCDGHGINGHFASDHVKEYLPANIELLDYMAVKQTLQNKATQPANGGPADSANSEEDFVEDTESYLLS
jgi:serine/threonine protein phosphatase PrpC